MHSSAYNHARLFFTQYWNSSFTDVVELGSQNVNGSLRDHCPPGVRYVGLDMAPAEGVDVVVKPGTPCPFPDASFDVALTSSVFEHDTCFWDTFVDLLRLLRPGGLLYVNAPSNYAFHRYPLDCWRFYPDAGHGLKEWARRCGVSVDLVESFVAKPEKNDGWADFVAVFRKSTDRPLIRKGRIADHTPAINVYDGACSTGFEVHRESEATFDMLELAQTIQSRDAMASKVEELTAAVAEARGALGQATESALASAQATASEARHIEELSLALATAEKLRAEVAQRAEELSFALANAEKLRAEEAQRAEELSLALANAEKLRAEEAQRADEACTDLANLNARLVAMQTSKSWRATAPLRRLRRWFPL
jgi:SAM-dependent methyltransferase